MDADSSPKVGKQVPGNLTSHSSPGAHDIVVIITRDLGVGDHAALYLEHGGDPVLYDPGGSYLRDTEDRPGSSAVFEGSPANLNDYVKYQRGTGSAVELYRFTVTEEEESAIAERISPNDMTQGEGEGGSFNCAYHVSRALSGIGPFKDLDTYKLPGNLAGALQSISESARPGYWTTIITQIAARLYYGNSLPPLIGF
jgi:hypothetical protein